MTSEYWQFAYKDEVKSKIALNFIASLIISSKSRLYFISLQLTIYLNFEILEKKIDNPSMSISISVDP